jgi:hypothetical protein
VESLTKENGGEMSDKAMVYKFGLMEPNIKDNGEIIKHQVKVNLFILMGTFMKDNGKMIKPMVMEYIFIIMERGIKDIGKMIIKMVTVYKNGQMEVDMRGHISRVKKTDKDNIFGLMVAHIKEIG